MRSGALSRSRASAISSRARERVVRSVARLVLCRARDCCALRWTVSIRAFLSPRCGMRSDTFDPRRVGEPLLYGFQGLGQRRDQHLLGHGLALLLPVQLLEGVLDEPGRSTASTLSVTQPRWPRTRPPRTWKICTAASSSSSATAIRSASVASASTTAFFSIARRSAPMSSRSRAAFSYSISSAASCISFSSRER